MIILNKNLKLKRIESTVNKMGKINKVFCALHWLKNYLKQRSNLFFFKLFIFFCDCKTAELQQTTNAVGYNENGLG